MAPGTRGQVERQHRNGVHAGGKRERERYVLAALALTGIHAPRQSHEEPCRQSICLYQKARVRFSSVSPGGVCTEVPEITAWYFLPSISTTTGTGEGR